MLTWCDIGHHHDFASLNFKLGTVWNGTWSTGHATVPVAQCTVKFWKLDNKEVQIFSVTTSNFKTWKWGKWNVSFTYTLGSWNNALSNRGLMFQLRAKLLGNDTLTWRTLRRGVANSACKIFYVIHTRHQLIRVRRLDDEELNGFSYSKIEILWYL